MNEYTISIVIPCYNCEALVGETLESVAKQTCRNFEVICINDGSKDGTLAVLREWESKNLFPMQIIDQPNGGVSRARNAGIEASRGEYLLFLDADDCYHSQFVERIYNALQLSDADVSYCTLNRNRELVEQATLPEQNRYVTQTQTEAMHHLLYRMADIGFYCYLYKRTILTEHQLRFDVNTRHFEDREFNWKYLCHCHSAAFIDISLYWYRINVNSVTQSKVITWKTEDLEAVRRIEEYLMRQECAFYSELKSYLFARLIWSKAKRYAVGGRKDLLRKLQEHYDVKGYMKRTAKDPNKLVALSSRMYLVHPMLFFYIVRLKK